MFQPVVNSWVWGWNAFVLKRWAIFVYNSLLTFSKESSFISGSRTLLSDCLRLVVWGQASRRCLSWEDSTLPKPPAKPALQAFHWRLLNLAISNNSYCLYCLFLGPQHFSVLETLSFISYFIILKETLVSIKLHTQ